MANVSVVSRNLQIARSLEKFHPVEYGSLNFLGAPINLLAVSNDFEKKTNQNSRDMNFNLTA
jgi:hypothetical protein